MRALFAEKEPQMLGEHLGAAGVGIYPAAGVIDISRAAVLSQFRNIAISHYRIIGTSRICNP